MASPAEPPADLAASELQRLCHVSGALTKADCRATLVMCEIGKAVLRKAAGELVADAAGAPILNSKSADGTPISVVLRMRRKMSTGAVLIRSGR